MHVVTVDHCLGSDIWLPVFAVSLP